MTWLFGEKENITDFFKEDAIVLDVRNPGEFASGRIEGSINIPLGQLSEKIESLDKSKPIIACCASGVRSGFAKRTLKNEGFKVMNGGGWRAVQTRLLKFQGK